MPGRKSGTELDDLNLHVKSPLANDLASRFGDLAQNRKVSNRSTATLRNGDGPGWITVARQILGGRPHVQDDLAVTADSSSPRGPDGLPGGVRWDY
jgi:hypothetical protein